MRKTSFVKDFLRIFILNPFVLFGLPVFVVAVIINELYHPNPIYTFAFIILSIGAFFGYRYLSLKREKEELEQNTKEKYK